MRDIRYLVVHTAAADIRNVDAAIIDDWHRKRGWEGIGYHYVIIDDRHDSLPDGALQVGRPEDKIGAHVAGLNRPSIGVCCVGHGDRRDFTARQKETLIDLLAQLSQKHDVTIANILGHREVNRLVDEGKLDAELRTSKSCPGGMVNMDEIRDLVRAKLAQSTLRPAAPSKELVNALNVIAANEDVLGNALPEWRSFFFSGEVRGLRQQEGPGSSHP